MNSIRDFVPTLTRWLAVSLLSLALAARAEIQITPSSASPGTVVGVSGHVPAGSHGVRLLWQHGPQAQGYLEGPVDASGAFSLSVGVPVDAAVGEVSIHSLPTETVDGPIDTALFHVLPAPTGTVTGTVTIPAPGAVPPFQAPPAGTKVCLKDSYGQIVACTTTGPGGTWVITVPPGVYTVATEVPGVQEPPVTVDPGSTPSVSVKPLTGTLQPICDAQFSLHSFEATSVSTGGLIGQPEVALGRKDSEPFARLISFNGKPGVPDVSIAFSTELEATCGMKIGNVVFTLRDAGGSILFQQVTESDKSPLDIDRRSVTLNASKLPGGTHSMEVQVFPGNAAFNPRTERWSFPVEVTDLSPRWLSGNAKKDGAQTMVQVTALPEEHALKYSLHALVPHSAIELDAGNITLGPLTLENDALLGLKLDETYDSERHFDGHAAGGAKIALMKLSAFNQTLKSIVDVDNIYALTGPKPVGGTGFFGTGYELPETSLGSSTEEVPIFGAGKQKCIKFCLFSCKKCVGFKIGLFAKVQGGADLGIKIGPDLGVRAVVAPCVKASLPLIFQLDVIVCSAGAKAEASATARLPLRFDFSNGLGFHFDNPNLHLQSTLKYYARCFGITFFRGSRTLASYQWGDGPAGDGCSDDFGLSPVPQQSRRGGVALADEPALTPDEEAGPVAPEEIPPMLQPAISVNGACQNLTVWIGGPQEGADADGRLRFSYTDADGSSVPANLDPAGAAAESPGVAWLDNTHAMAVWVQSTAPLTDLAFDVEPSMPATLELAYAVWDVTTLTWSEPQFVTQDDRWDLRPVLTADPITGDALVVWMRQHEVNPAVPEPTEPRGLYYALYHEGAWSAPARLIDTTSDFYYQPTIRFDRAGVAHAVVVGDLDGNAETAYDRSLKLLELGAAGWTITEEVPTPLGAFNPSLDFDTANQPVVAYLVPGTAPEDQLPTGGDGNGSTLGLAQKFEGSWRNTGDTAVAGERPILRVDPSNRAFVLLRRFGHGEDGGVHDTGDRGISQAELGASSLTLTSSYATGDGQLHWEPTFDLDPATGCAVYGESAGDPSGTGVGVQHGIVPRGPNLCVVNGSLQASDPHPAIGQVISVGFRLVNQGLDPAVGGFKVKFYDGVPAPRKIPFAIVELPRLFPPGFGINISRDYTNLAAGQHLITAVVDEDNQITETDKSNNLGTVVLGEVPGVCQITGRPTDDGKGVQLDWEAPAFTTDAAPVFFLQRRTLPVGPWEILGFGTQPSFIDPLAKPGIPYEYRVVVRDGAGVYSPPCGTTLAQIDGRPVDPGHPILSVRFDGGRSATLIWSGAATGFSVETTTDLGSDPIIWSPAGDSAVLVGDHFEVTVPAGESQRFYRLTQP